MGDIKVHNSAGANDNPQTVTSVNNTVGRVIDLFMTKQEMEELNNQVATNSQNVIEMTEGAPVSLNSFKEVSDNLDVGSFLAALDGDE
jgi:hypothetical protein|tara:strand:+ start:1419 stop:1682 length:264 start_codon:yes stop_codon:yes gene_type:complete